MVCKPLRATLAAVLLCGTVAAASSIDSAGVGPLADLALLGGGRTARASSNDPTTANNDWVPIEPGETKVIFDQRGPGCIRHIWATLKSKKIIGEPDYHLRWIVIRMFWDGEKEPSVEVPLGDFFGLGHAEYYSYTSLPMVVAVKKGMNCFFAMPFDSLARIEIENQGEVPVEKFYYNINFELYDEPIGEDWGRFHAAWRRENPTQPAEDRGAEKAGVEDNYVILEAQGRGRYLGCNLAVLPLSGGWWGEGDEFIAIDGATPQIKGTGTEDYFGCAWGFPDEVHTPYFGVAYLDSIKDPEKTCVYRWHIEDPVNFEKSIKVSIEHGAGNLRSDDIASTAYWYQSEPHVTLAPLPPVADRLPGERSTPLPEDEESRSTTKPVVLPTFDSEPETDPLSIEMGALVAILKYVWLPVIVAAGIRYGWRRIARPGPEG